MNALSKLVLFSSFVHQLGFFLFSSLPFAIGMVQDAGLIFLSSMANKIANTLQGQGESDEAIISTTIVLLSMGTAALGVVLIVMGTFKLADAVAYLPMPVVGGYLAFIGYFCFMAGVGLCISQTMMDLGDWAHLSDPKNMLLAFPGLVAAGALTYASRHEHSSILLPVCMVTLPAIFYVVIYCIPGAGGLNKARAGGWVAEVAAPTPVTDLLTLVDFSLVHWSLIPDLLSTWIGMVFVVSFASCLDVAAIAMDMGSALDTNAELATVGVANCKS
jgi:sulfate permease, SulP family